MVTNWINDVKPGYDSDTKLNREILKAKHKADAERKMAKIKAERKKKMNKCWRYFAMYFTETFIILLCALVLICTITGAWYLGGGAK